MRTEEFNYPSADKRTEIHSFRWIPDGEVRAIVQIAHGMVEHISRYARFAEFLTEQGILVTGNDHLGHGKSVADDDSLWHFPLDGNKILLKDMHTLRQMTQAKYPGVPYIMLGHSMGSFLTRQYLCLEGEGLAGSIIVGTGDQPTGILRMGSAMSAIKNRVQGLSHHSRLLTFMSLGSYNKRIKPAPTKLEWLSRDEETVRAYNEDPLCGGLFTNNAYHEMFKSMLYLKKKENLRRMPKDLPILLASGEEDPVGSYGKGVYSVAEKYRSLGMKDVSLILYPGARHEILNEINRDQVYQDFLSWINEKI